MNDFERKIAFKNGFEHLHRFYLMTEKLDDKKLRDEQKLEVCELAKAWIKAFEIDDIVAAYIEAFRTYKTYVETDDEEKYHIWTKLESKLEAETMMEFLDNVLSDNALLLIRQATGSNEIGKRKIKGNFRVTDKTQAKAQRMARAKWVERYVEEYPEMEDYLYCYLDDQNRERE